MTQTQFAVAATPTIRTVAPYVAQTIGYRNSRMGMQIRYHLQQNVAQARTEFGPTLTDAQAFAADITCQGCGRAACELVECWDCGVQLCECLVTEDPHDGEDRCDQCTRSCAGCRGCEG